MQPDDRGQARGVRQGLVLAGLALATAAFSLHAARAASAQEVAAPAPQQVALPYSFQDDLGTQWDVGADGSVGSGNLNIFDAGGRLFVGQNEQYAPTQQTAQFDPAHNELTFARQPLAGLNVSRRVSVDTHGGWCRWVEILENPTGAAIKTQVHVNFDLSAAVQNTVAVASDKDHALGGLAVFDGNHGIAMVAGGHGATSPPTFVPQQGNDQVDVTWDVEAPAKKTIAIVHLQAVRGSLNDAQALLQRTTDRQALHDLPPTLLRTIVNFANHSGTFGDLELLRGDVLDVVELRGGDQYKGVIQEKSITVATPYGVVAVPIENTLAMLTIGDYRPTQLVVTRAGEAFGGTLQAPVIHLQLSSGQVTSIPVGDIRRIGLRKLDNEPEEFKYDHPMLILRAGDRIAVGMPIGPIAVQTRYGSLSLKSQSIGALIFQGDDQPVHQVLLSDGSRVAGLVGQESLELRPLSIGSEKPVSFPITSISRLQFIPRIEEPTEQSPVLTLSTGDRLAGALTGKLVIETAFDAIEIDGSQVRGMHHSGSAPTEVQVMLWDETSLSGRLKGDVITMSLKSGPTLAAPTSLLEQYVQPQPLPPASVLEKLRPLVADLGSDDWKRVERASAELESMGAKISGALKTMRGGQSQTIQGRIDAIVAKSIPRVVTPPPPDTQPADQVQQNQVLQNKF